MDKEYEAMLNERVMDIMEKPDDYLETWIRDHLREFHRVDKALKDRDDEIERLGVCEDEIYADLKKSTALLDEMGEALEKSREFISHKPMCSYSRNFRCTCGSDQAWDFIGGIRTKYKLWQERGRG